MANINKQTNKIELVFFSYISLVNYEQLKSLFFAKFIKVVMPSKNKVTLKQFLILLIFDKQFHINRY